MSTWERIIEGAAQGPLQVKLPAAVRVPRPRKTRGRPRVRGATLFGHYAGYKEEEGGRPRCRKSGCSRWLKKHQLFGCSESHEREVIDNARAVLNKVQNA